MKGGVVGTRVKRKGRTNEELVWACTWICADVDMLCY